MNKQAIAKFAKDTVIIGVLMYVPYYYLKNWDDIFKKEDSIYYSIFGVKSKEVNLK